MQKPTDFPTHPDLTAQLLTVQLKLKVKLNVCGGLTVESRGLGLSGRMEVDVESKG